MDFGRYEYASASCASARPSSGTAPRNQIVLPARRTGFVGTAASRATKRPPTRRTRAISLNTEVSSTKLRSANPQTTPSKPRVAERELRRVAPNEGGAGVRGGEHAGRVVDADSAVTTESDVVRKVAGATREVEYR